MKIYDLYQARRFYNKAKQIKDIDDTDKRQLVERCYYELHLTPFRKAQSELLVEWGCLSFNTSPLRGKHLENKKTKTRLLIGEGTFTYTDALLTKHANTHPNLAKTITATEFLSSPDDDTKTRVKKLEEKGVYIRFGIDGRQIHKTFSGKRFERIHWNCPFGGSTQREQFKAVIPKFFLSCSKIQILGDRIHVTLMNGWIQYGFDQRQKENPILAGSVQAGYRLIRKRRFDDERYPGYKHVKTGSAKSYDGGGKPREFVFEKVDLSGMRDLKDIEKAEKLKNSAEKEYQLKSNQNGSQNLDDYYFECSTDEDSSDYYESDIEQVDAME